MPMDHQAVVSALSNKGMLTTNQIAIRFNVSLERNGCYSRKLIDVPLQRQRWLVRCDGQHGDVAKRRPYRDSNARPDAKIACLSIELANSADDTF